MIVSQGLSWITRWVAFKLPRLVKSAFSFESAPKGPEAKRSFMGDFEQMLASQVKLASRFED